MGSTALLVCLVATVALAVSPRRAAADAAYAPPAMSFVRVSGDHFEVDQQPFVMRGFNYYPRDYGWSAMTEWDWSEVDQELGLAAGLGANTIRTVVDYGFSTNHPGEDWPPEAVSRFDHPSAAYLAAMDQLLAIASRHGLRVVFSMFDFMPGWSFVDRGQYGPATSYATELVTHFANDPRIAAWDILNEGDLLPDKFPGTSLASVLGFYAAMSAAIKAADQQHLVTADFGNIERAALSQDFVDYVSFHYYADQARLTLAIDALRGSLRRPMPIVAGELGAPSDGNPYASMSSHTVALGAYLDSVLVARALAGALVWTLVDPNPPKTALTRQGRIGLLDYGIYDGNLQPKPSAALVRGYFTGGCQSNASIELRFPGGLPGPGPGDSRTLTIGVHQLTLLRGDGTALSQLTFGTPAADAVEGQGWYADENWGQWAGELGGTATLCLSAPADTAMLRLTAHSGQPDTEVQVWVDGTQRGSVVLQPTAAEYLVKLS